MGPDTVTTLLAVVGAFVGAFGVLVGATALGARWLGRAESERELASAKEYALAVDRDRRVLEYRALSTTAGTYRSADHQVKEDVRRSTELVDGQVDAAAARARTVQLYGERLADAEGVAARIPDRLDHPRSFVGAVGTLPASVMGTSESERPRIPPRRSTGLRAAIATLRRGRSASRWPRSTPRGGALPRRSR